MERRYYRNINGLRAISCLGIVAMHIRANTNYEFEGFFYNTVILSWTQFVYLFLIISGFGMSYGYYDKFKNGEVNIETFYSKRYSKILPFFSILIIVDLILERSIESIYEGIIELTMVFGLLPNNSLDVIGVSWTLGVIFLFYMLFPFFVYLLGNRKRAWISFIISILINYMCSSYFFSEKFVINTFTARHSFLYCAPFFICGGLIYLCKEGLTKWIDKYNGIHLVICIVLTGLYYTMGEFNSTIGLLMLFSAWVIYALGKDCRILSNKLMDFIGSVSLEIYLSHMFVFRVIEKLGIVRALGNSWYSYCIVCGLTVVGVLIFVYAYRLVFNKIKKTFERIKNHE